jgi:flagellar biosynthesis protein FlhF
MKLKTFNAPTMADALAAVRKELGPDAMILHTRSYRVGSWFGLGGKNMVEITASAGEPEKKTKPRVRQAPEPKSLPREDTADERSLVLGGESRAARALHAAREPAEVVVQRASAIVEPKPILSVRVPPPPIPAAVEPTPRTPIRDESREAQPPRLPIATRLPRRDDAPPVRIADATPPRDVPADRPTMTDRFTAGVIEPKREPRREETPASSQPDQSPAELRQQIDQLQKMMGQVLESTRRTSLAMGKVDPKLAETVEPGPLLELTNKLVDNDTPVAVADRIIGRVRDRLDPIELRDPVVVRQAVLREIEATIDTRADSMLAISAGASTGKPRVLALVGPTGVGKTTTVAKLAAACKLRHARRVGLITSDTYRIAAVEQLRTYAQIIGLQIKVVMSPEEMAGAVASLSGMDVIIVDTAGRSQHDARRLDELKAFVDAAGADETHLVLSSTVGETVLNRTADRFKVLGPDRVILTKLDEAVCTGQLVGLTGRIGLPLSFVTTGQEVPDDIEPARADRLARVALDGPQVLFGGVDGRD